MSSSIFFSMRKTSDSYTVNKTIDTNILMQQQSMISNNKSTKLSPNLNRKMTLNDKFDDISTVKSINNHNNNSDNIIIDNTNNEQSHLSVNTLDIRINRIDDNNDNKNQCIKRRSSLSLSTSISTSSSSMSTNTYINNNFNINKFDNNDHNKTCNSSSQTPSISDASCDETCEDYQTTNDTNNDNAEKQNDDNKFNENTDPNQTYQEQITLGNVQMMLNHKQMTDEDHFNKAFVPDKDLNVKNDDDINNENEMKSIADNDLFNDQPQFILKPSKNLMQNANCFVSLFINNKRCLCMFNNEYLTFEPELTSTMADSSKSDNTERVTIKLSNMMAVWICKCYKKMNQSYHNKKSSIPFMCDCIAVKNTNNNLNEWSRNRNSVINPSDKWPLIIRIYYVSEDDKCNKDGYQLQLLTLSTHNNDFKRKPMPVSFSKNDTDYEIDNNDNDIAINNETRLLTEIAYSIRSKLELFDRPKRLLIFINPFGGSKNGIKIFEKQIKPILNITRIESNVIITEHANQAKSRILSKKTQLNEFDGIICIGGDGMFNEVLNGILIRTQLENNIDFNNIDAVLKQPTIKLGIIPAGSTDAIVYATCGHKNPIHSILSIVIGHTISIDVGAVHNRNDDEQLIRYTASFLGYGFFGDTIQESERLRWMGPKRYDWAGIKKFLKHRLYSGEIKICLEPNDGSPKDYNPCGINCTTCKQAGIKSRTTLSVEDSPACISIRGRFLAINSAIVSGRCHMSKYGMSPMAHVGNGCADLILVSKCSRFQFFKYLFSVAFHNKSPFDYDFIDSYRVREFEFNPIVEPTRHKRKGYMVEKSIDYDFFDTFDDCYEDYGDNDNHNTITDGTSIKQKQQRKQSIAKKRGHLRSSVWNCDGEIVNEPAIHVKIHCQLVELYASGFNVGQLLAHSNICR